MLRRLDVVELLAHLLRERNDTEFLAMYAQDHKAQNLAFQPSNLELWMKSSKQYHHLRLKNDA